MVETEPPPGARASASLRSAFAAVRRPADLWRLRELRYLVVGGLNTLVGYGLCVGLYVALEPILHLVAIGLIGNVLAISFSFTTYKVLVFQTRGRWFPEYLRSYVVYGGSAVIGILLVWLLVGGFSVPIWIAQGFAVLVTVVVSYVAHSRFTFRRAVCGPVDG